MTTSPSARLDELSLGFRDRFLSHDELTQQVEAWAGAFPDICRLTSIGKTPEGRQLWLLTLGPDPDRVRPSAFETSSPVMVSAMPSSRLGNTSKSPASSQKPRSASVLRRSASKSGCPGVTHSN